MYIIEHIFLQDSNKLKNVLSFGAIGAKMFPVSPFKAEQQNIPVVKGILWGVHWTDKTKPITEKTKFLIYY